MRKPKTRTQIHDIQWALALQRANNYVLFDVFVLSSSFPVSRGELAALLFQKQRKVESAIRRKTFRHFTKHLFNRTIQMSHFATLIYTAPWGCFLLCEVIIINPSLINQMQQQVSIYFHLCEAAGCFLSASGKGECMLDQTQLPARGCHRDL